MFLVVVKATEMRVFGILFFSASLFTVLVYSPEANAILLDAPQANCYNDGQCRSGLCREVTNGLCAAGGKQITLCEFV